MTQQKRKDSDKVHRLVLRLFPFAHPSNVLAAIVKMCQNICISHCMHSFLIACTAPHRLFVYRTATMDSNFQHFERAAEGRRDQIRISHFERDFGEFGDLKAHDSNGPAVRTNLWGGLQQGAAAGSLCVF
jgi:hypothetical protein